MFQPQSFQTTMKSLVFALAFLGLSGIAHAQSDALATCLADSTTGKDRKDLARWVFVAMSAHPGMRDLAANSPETGEQINKAMGVLVTRLLTESCPREVQAVAKGSEGAQGLRSAFEALGRLAMAELMSNAEVSASVSKFEGYVDRPKVSAVLNSK